MQVSVTVPEYREKTTVVSSTVCKLLQYQYIRNAVFITAEQSEYIKKTESNDILEIKVPAPMHWKYQVSLESTKCSLLFISSLGYYQSVFSNTYSTQVNVSSFDTITYLMNLYWTRYYKNYLFWLNEFLVGKTLHIFWCVSIICKQWMIPL